MSKIHPDMIDELLKDYKKPEGVIRDDDLLKQLTKAILERALESELTHQLGYEKHIRTENSTGNSHDGKSSKTLKTDHDDMKILIPRDRTSDFALKLSRSDNVGIPALMTEYCRCIPVE